MCTLRLLSHEGSQLIPGHSAIANHTILKAVNTSADIREEGLTGPNTKAGLPEYFLGIFSQNNPGFPTIKCNPARESIVFDNKRRAATAA
jgi:hypothetical protein